MGFNKNKNPNLLTIERHNEQELDKAIQDLLKRGYILLHKGKLKVGVLKHKYLAKLKKEVM